MAKWYGITGAIGFHCYVNSFTAYAGAINNPLLSGVGPGEFICTYRNASNELRLIRSGAWASNGDEQGETPQYASFVGLANNVRLKFPCGDAFVDDFYAFKPSYEYAAENVVGDSPSVAWRSVTTNKDNHMIFDLEDRRAHFRAAAFFNCNVTPVKLQLNDVNSWTSPAVDVEFDFVISSVQVTSATGSALFAGVVNSYAHGLAERHYCRFLDGTLAGTTYKVLGNDETGWLFTDANSDISGDVSSGDGLIVFARQCAVTSFANAGYQFLRILVESQQTAEGYHQIGELRGGMQRELKDAIRVGYGTTHVADFLTQRTAAGGPIRIGGQAERRRVFDVQWPQSEAGRKAALATINYAEGRNLVLMLDTNSVHDCVLVKAKNKVKDQHRILERGDLRVNFEEVV
jgi:hypothetical protein